MTDESCLVAGPIASIDEAIARMQAIDVALPVADGLACFNRMYLGITETVGAHVQAGFFADPVFMARLDVVFANLYFAAVAASMQEPDRTPRCWAPLLQRRDDGSVAPIQFALAGMNAHINHDLPVAVVNTCIDLATAPHAGSHHDDYLRVNPVLEAAEQSVRESFESGVVKAADETVATLANVVSNWSLVEARGAAWTNAEAIWELRRVPWLEERYLDALDGTVGLAGRGLLIPTS